MQVVDLATILTNIEGRADLPVLGTATFITKTQMTGWINQSGRKLAGKLIKAHGEGHFATTQDISTTANQDYTTLADSQTPVETDIYRVIGLHVTLDGERIPLDRADAEDLDMEGTNANTGWSLGRRPKWEFREYADQRFLWSRTPDAVHTVKVHYVPYFVFINFTEGAPGDGLAAMSHETNHAMHSHLGWDEWVVLDCAIKAAKFQGLPADEWQGLLMEQKELEADIAPAARLRTDKPKRTRLVWRSRRRGRSEWLTR